MWSIFLLHTLSYILDIYIYIDIHTKCCKRIPIYNTNHTNPYISKNRRWFVGGKTTQVKTFDGFVKPSGLCVANDQLVVVDRGAHQVHCTVIVWKIVDLRCFFCKLRHIKTTTEMCDLVGHRCVFRCVFVVGEFSDIPNGHQVYWPSPLCLSASTWIPFALVRLELLPHVGMTCTQYESSTELLQLHTIRQRFTQVVFDWWVTALIKFISLMYVFKFVDLLCNF